MTKIILFNNKANRLITMTEQLEAKYNVKSECFQNQKNEFFLVRGQSIYSDFSEFMHIT